MSRLYKDLKNRFLQTVSPVLASVRTANIAMFHVGRVGSTVVAELLGQHSRIDWAGELHHPRNVELWKSHLHEDDPVRRLRSRMALSGLKVFGFETKYIEGADLERLEQSLTDYINQLLSLGFTHFILLERKNLLRRFVSTKVGQQRGKWHNRSDATLTTVELDLENIFSGDIQKPFWGWIESLEEDKRHIMETVDNNQLLRLTYEDHVRDNPKQAYRKICHFVGLDPEPADITIRKSNPFPLSKILTNYQEVAAQLEGTEYEWMLSS